MSAKHDHLLADKRAIELVLVFAKLLPVIAFDPERVAADSQTGVTLAQSGAEFRIR
jgi:hypothetical protein